MPRVFRRPAVCQVPHGVRSYASGSNFAGEIRGFAHVGIPVGIAADVVKPGAIAELLALPPTYPIFVDSGAFSEVVFDPAPRVVAPIDNDAWRARLDLYATLAARFGSHLLCVAPDRVGCQATTVDRLRCYRAEVQQIAATGAEVLVPLQRGDEPADSFYHAATRAAGVATLIPAFPMKKAATPADDVLEFVRRVRPARLHLLGLGLTNRITPKLLAAIATLSPGTFITLDSCLLRAAVGRDNGPDGGPRTVTEALGAIWGDLPEPIDAMVEIPGWETLNGGAALEYPSTWMPPDELRRVAADAGLSTELTARWVDWPDLVLANGVSWADEQIGAPMYLRWALDAAWRRHVHGRMTQRRKAVATVDAFLLNPNAFQVAPVDHDDLRWVQEGMWHDAPAERAGAPPRTPRRAEADLQYTVFGGVTLAS